MGCANVPGEPTPPTQPSNPAGSRALSQDRDQVTNADIRAALRKVAAINARESEAAAAIDRVLKEMDKDRGAGERKIEVSNPGYREGKTVMSNRGNPVISLHTLLNQPDREFRSTSSRPWSEFQGSRELEWKQTRHGDRYAEVLIVTKLDGSKEAVLSIPRSNALAVKLFEKPPRREGSR